MATIMTFRARTLPSGTWLATSQQLKNFSVREETLEDLYDACGRAFFVAGLKGFDDWQLIIPGEEDKP